MWQQRIFMLSGLLAAVLLSFTAVRSVIGLSTSEKPTPPRAYKIPAFEALLACDAHFSHEILRVKNKMPAHYSEADLPLLHRNYRRLHRLVRQVGRRDGIVPEEQTKRLVNRVKQLNLQPTNTSAAERDARCRAMAEMPIARNRYSQRIVGR